MSSSLRSSSSLQANGGTFLDSFERGLDGILIAVHMSHGFLIQKPSPAIHHTIRSYNTVQEAYIMLEYVRAIAYPSMIRRKLHQASCNRRPVILDPWYPSLRHFLLGSHRVDGDLESAYPITSAAERAWPK